MYMWIMILPWNLKTCASFPFVQNMDLEITLPQVITLSQAIKQGIAVVSERGTASTENVHFLRINNHSDQTIYISSGEIISGGRQDRMVAQDTLLEPNGRDQYVSVMCVEELRWSEKEKKFAYEGFANPDAAKSAG